MRPFARDVRYAAILFTRSSKSTGVLLILCTVISLLVSNIPGGQGYLHFWQAAPVILQGIQLPQTMVSWVNDGLMALFFLSAGMEIKKELLVGELASLKKAILPLLCAAGGVIMPAVIFALANKGTAFANGWGIPTATDIAFSIAILGLLGPKYVPASLKVFLMALAIIDDLIAILIVAFFYGEAIQWAWLLALAAIAYLLYILFRKYPGVGIPHILLGLLLWYATWRSGVHATMAGVIFSFLIPVSALKKTESKLYKPVNFFIIPLFALANTCISLAMDWDAVFHSTLFWGITVGLFLGKVSGITLMCYILVKLNWARLPRQSGWYQFTGVGILAGIGFTMSLFIATLAFPHKEWQDISKIAILIGSTLSMATGYIWLRCQTLKKR